MGRLPYSYRNPQSIDRYCSSTATCLVCQQQGQAVPDKATQKIVRGPQSTVEINQGYCRSNRCKSSAPSNTTSASGRESSRTSRYTVTRNRFQEYGIQGHVAVCQHKDIVCSNGCGEVYQKMNEVDWKIDTHPKSPKKKSIILHRPTISLTTVASVVTFALTVRRKYPSREWQSISRYCSNRILSYRTPHSGLSIRSRHLSKPVRTGGHQSRGGTVTYRNPVSIYRIPAG